MSYFYDDGRPIQFNMLALAVRHYRKRKQQKEAAQKEPEASKHLHQVSRVDVSFSRWHAPPNEYFLRTSRSPIKPELKQQASRLFKVADDESDRKLTLVLWFDRSLTHLLAVASRRRQIAALWNLVDTAKILSPYYLECHHAHHTL